MSRKHYTFSFGQYERGRLERFQEGYSKRWKAKLKAGAIMMGGVSLLGLVYPVMMWF
jgi:hypothetical protein